MRDSFIFHADFLEDLEEELRPEYLKYIYDYGINEKEPKLTGLKKTVWLKIKRHMDADKLAWESTKERRAEAGRKSGWIRRNKPKAITSPDVLEQYQIRLEPEKKVEEIRDGFSDLQI